MKHNICVDALYGYEEPPLRLGGHFWRSDRGSVLASVEGRSRHLATWRLIFRFAGVHKYVGDGMAFRTSLREPLKNTSTGYRAPIATRSIAFQPSRIFHPRRGLKKARGSPCAGHGHFSEIAVIRPLYRMSHRDRGFYCSGVSSQCDERNDSSLIRNH